MLRTRDQMFCGPALRSFRQNTGEMNSNMQVSAGCLTPIGVRKVSIWGTASRDPQIGAPVGRTYMDSVVRILPGADIKDSDENPGNWYVRFNGRSTIPLKELLSRESEWISAMAQVVQKLQQNSELA